MASIRFFAEDTAFELPNAKVVSNWIQNCIQAADKKLVYINYIFCSDPYLHNLNKEYLQHDHLTDILTFSYAEHEYDIEGDAYISIDRIKEHASIFQATFYHELCRVIIHAVLHLLGYKDKTPTEKTHMHSLENFWLDKAILKNYLKKLPPDLSLYP